MEEILLMNTPIPDDYKISKIFGLVTGMTVRTRGFGGSFVAGLESFVGGEVTTYTSEMEKARFEAVERMKEKAIKLGANAIVGIDFETSEVFAGAVMITATGTAMVASKK